MKAKSEEKKKARSMRRRGYSVKEIAEILAVAKSSVSVWVRGQEISTEGRSRLAERNKIGRSKVGDPPRNEKWIQECARKRQEWREEGKRVAALGHPLHVMACSLYWGEGAKSKWTTSICNSDVHILKSFLKFLRVYFEIDERDLTFRVFSYTDIKKEDQIIEYWTDELGLDRSMMKKSYFNPGKYKSKGNSPKLFAKSAYGTCYITIRKSTHVIQHIYGALEFYSGADVFKRLY